MRAAKVQASLRIRAVSPEPPLLAHTSSESRGTFRQKARSLAPLNGWACAVKICHDGMLEDTNSLDAPHQTLDIPSGSKEPNLSREIYKPYLPNRKKNIILLYVQSVDDYYRTFESSFNQLTRKCTTPTPLVLNASTDVTTP